MKKAGKVLGTLMFCAIMTFATPVEAQTTDNTTTTTRTAEDRDDDDGDEGKWGLAGLLGLLGLLGLKRRDDQRNNTHTNR